MSTTFHLWLSNLQIAALPRHPRFQASWSNVFHSSFLFFFFIIFLFYHFFIIIIIFAAFDSVVRFCGLLSISCDTCVSFCTECDLGLTEKVLCGLQRFSQIAFEHCELKPFVCPKQLHFSRFCHSSCTWLNNFCWSHELSNYFLCLRQQGNFHIWMTSHQYTSSHDWSYYCTGSSFHSVCSSLPCENSYVF